MHDLATPLSAVSLHLEAADRRVRRGADPSESLAIARAEIARAFDLFDRGRELLLLEPSAEEPVPFDELVSSVLAGSGAGEAKVAGRTGGFVRGDRSALSDMLRAVLTNALEASPASGLSIALDRAQGDLEVRFENPGRLPAGDPESLFSPRVAAPGKSWGMGLARARLLCAASGGTIRVEQTGDRVATTVRIPEVTA
ncbi:MAG TPA: ATP-binding protein [Thermoanaerobaculia bacterium]|nr:ATP-binding protein [Thermoanaerobaculia bacterium]